MATACDAWNGHGVRTASLSALLDAASNWLGIRRPQFTACADNAPAIRLQSRAGFEIKGTHRACAPRDDRNVDTHTMARLGGPDPLAGISGHGKDRLGLDAAGQRSRSCRINE